MYKILEIKDNKELFKEILENYLVELQRMKYLETARSPLL